MPRRRRRPKETPEEELIRVQDETIAVLEEHLDIRGKRLEILEQLCAIYEMPPMEARH